MKKFWLILVIVLLMLGCFCKAGKCWTSGNFMPTKLADIAHVFGASDTVMSTAVNAKGVVNMIVVKIPNWTNTVSTTITIEDGSGNTYYSSGAQTQNQTVTLTFERPVYPYSIIKTTLSGAPGGSGGTETLSVHLK